MLDREISLRYFACTLRPLRLIWSSTQKKFGFALMCNLIFNRKGRKVHAKFRKELPAYPLRKKEQSGWLVC